MSIVQCKHCGKEVIETAKKCPHCDSLGPKKGKRMKWVILGMFLLLIIGVVALFWSRSQEKKKSHEEVVKERRDEKIAQRAMTVLMLLRTKIEVPESLKIESVKSNEDGSVLCFQYSAKNNDGKVKAERTTFVDGELSMTETSWNFYCTNKTLADVKLAN